MSVDPRNVSVIICAYTLVRWNDLVESVASVQRQPTPPREVIVVVDNNPALLAKASASLTGALVVENGETPGLRGARNSGVAAAQGEVVAFLDDDAVAAPDWLEQLCRGYADAQVVGVGGSAYPSYAGARPAWFPEEFGWVVGCAYKGMPEQTEPVRNILGCNMSFRREAVLAIGGFYLGYSCDDTEFCIRLRQKRPDSTLLYRPEAKIYHKVSRGRERWRYFCSRCFMEGGSKARMASMVGARDGLASERTYTFHTLPRGVLKGLQDTVLRRDVSGLARAATITAGLALTTAGYVRGKAFPSPCAG